MAGGSFLVSPLPPTHGGVERTAVAPCQERAAGGEVMDGDIPKAPASRPPETFNSRHFADLAALDSLPGLTRQERHAVDEIIRLTWGCKEISGPGGVRSVLCNLMNRDMRQKLGKDEP